MDAPPRHPRHVDPLGKSSEVNRTTVMYLSRQGTYSIEKARRLLGYEARVGRDEGLERTARWLREQGLLGPLRGG